MQKRNTFQRQMVLDALLSLRIHATAEMVYREVAARYTGISLATVYRNLNSLAHAGQVKKIPAPGGPDRFDFQTHPHYHLSCEACGRFEDAAIPFSEELRGMAESTSGYQIKGYNIVFTGICPSCAEKTLTTV